MIWVQHDFYRNFTSSSNSNNIGLGLDIFRSELSDLMTYKSEVLISLFDKLKIKHSKKPSYEELLDTTIREMKINDKFVRGLSFVIGENNNVIKNNKNVSWEKLLNGITKGIKKIGKYFLDNPRQEKLFRKKALEMTGVKSSIMGDDNRDLKTKDNTVLWVIGIGLVCVVGYLVFRHFDKIKQDKLRAESLNSLGSKLETGGSLNPPTPLDATGTANPNPANPVAPITPINPIAPVAPVNTAPEYNVSSEVLLPPSSIATPMTPAPMNNGGVNINVNPPMANQVVNQVPIGNM